MHLDGRSRLRLGTASNRLCRWLAVLFPATLVGSVFGQSYLATPPGFNGAPAVPVMGNVNPAANPGNGQVSSQTLNQINSLANGPTPSNANGQTPETTEGGTEAKPETSLAAPADAIASWGAAHVHPHVSYQFLWASGVHSSIGNSEDTFTHTISPGVTLVLGPHVTLDYTPSLRFYSEKDFHDTVDHSVNLNAGYNVGNWTLGLSQGVSITDEALVETSGQVGQSSYTTSLVASYNMNEKITLETTAGISLEYANGSSSTNIFVGGPDAAAAQLTDSQDYHAAEKLDYKFSDKFFGGFSFSVGYTGQTGGFKSYDENAGVHVGWHPGTKFSATVSAGFEQRSFADSKASSVWNPVYSADIQYKMFEHTELALYANRSTEASIFAHQITENTSVGLGLQQRLLGRMRLSLGFSYSTVDFQSTETSDLSKTRGDNSTSFTAGLSVPFLRRCAFATFYQYSKNNSSQEGFGSDSSQVGATLSWSY